MGNNVLVWIPGFVDRPGCLYPFTEDKAPIPETCVFPADLGYIERIEMGVVRKFELE